MKSGFIYIANHVFESLLALSEEEQIQGLMEQPWRPPVMSFVYSYPKINKFWMHRTPSPLDIIFCCNNKIINIDKGEPYSTAVIGSDHQSDLVIELPYGTVKNCQLKLNQKVGMLPSTLREIKKVFAANSYNMNAF